MLDEGVLFFSLLVSRGDAQIPLAASCVLLWREQCLVACFALHQEYLSGRKLQYLALI